MSSNDSTRSTSWSPDVIEGYEQHEIELGEDPDGEGRAVAVLVRRPVRDGEQVRGVMLHVHGFSDYFFQTDLADFAAAHGLAFYALDLRKCGRARREGQSAHYVSDLALYDVELDAATAIVAAEHPDVPVVLEGHSTGGLVTALYLDRRRREGRLAPYAGLVHNSPWYDLQGKPSMRGVLTWAMHAVSTVRPLRPLNLPAGNYGRTLHVEGTGEWEFDTEWKPLTGFPIIVGWLSAVRKAQARLHRGLDVGVPALVLRSETTHYSRRYSEKSDRADIVLDVRQIARWAGCLGTKTWIVPIADARHDVFLSLHGPREEAYAVLERWLADNDLGA
ncbi:alpha/beta hydrolase [Nocardioidaceae bacterium]|nr:alpha/beta hydrolase [Nocardioidaceae bacterium]